MDGRGARLTIDASKHTTRRPAGLLWPASAWWLALPALAFLAVFFAWPTVALLARGAAQLGSAAGTIPWHRVGSAVATTFELAAMGTALTLAVGMPAAWALFRRAWTGQRFAIAAVTAPFVLPTVVVASAFTAVVRGTGLADTRQGAMATIVAALSFFNVAVVVRIVGPAWAALSDGPYLAARTLGASHLRALWSVTLPSLRPAILAAAGTVWLFCSASFGMVLVIGGGTIATVDTEVWLQATRFLNLSAASVLALIQVAIIGAALALGAQLNARSARSSHRARSEPAQRVAGRRGVAAVALALAPAAVLLLLPAVALVMRSVTVRGGRGLGNYGALLSGESVAGSSSSAYDAAAFSIQAAAGTSLVATALAVGAGLVIAKRPRSGWMHAGVLLPLGVSSVVVGLGTLITLSRPLPTGANLANTGLLIPIAHIIVSLPLAVAVIVPALRSVPWGLTAAAATLGASAARTWWRVEWPLVRRAVALAAGLASAVSMGEFGATTFLARPGHETLPVLIVRLLGRPGAESVGMAFAAAVLLAAITVAIMLAADAHRPAHRRHS